MLLKNFFEENIAHGLNLSFYQNESWTHWTQGCGDFSQVPLDHEQFFDIASLTKTFTSTLTLNTAQKQKDFRLDDPIGRFLPDWKNQFEQITIERLLTHCSALWRLFPKPVIGQITAKEFYQIVLEPNNYEIRGFVRTNYFDYNYILLGHILEVVYQAPLDQVLQNFLEFYDLTEVSYRPKVKIVKTSQEIALDTAHDEKVGILDRPTGHAGLFATHQSLIKWIEIWLQNRFGFDRYFYDQAFGTKQQIPSLEIKDEVYGLVWRQGRYSQKYWNHAGFTGPAIFLDPQKQEAIVLTCSHLAVEDSEAQREKYRKWLKKLGKF